MRTRLTAWAVLAFALIAVAGVALTYVLLGVQLQRHVRQDIDAELSLYADYVAVADGGGALLDRTREYLAGTHSASLRRRGMVLVLVTEEGRVLSNAQDVLLEDLPGSDRLFAQGAALSDSIETESGTMVVAGAPVFLDGQQVAAVEVAAPLEPVLNVRGEAFILIVGAAGLALLLVGAGSWILVGKALDPVRRISRTAAGISREDLSRRVEYEGPPDELGELVETMNGMLSRLEAAFASQDRFISDVSHELRTPLTIIRGHLQVLDKQEQLDEEHVRETHTLVLEELGRLNRLVADLLTLARAERTDLLDVDSFEVDEFLRTLVDQGRHLADRAWRLEHLPGVVVNADRDRLTQAFLNLMANAVNHTDTADVIALGGRLRGESVTLWVRDEGEGMSEEARERVFERFYTEGGSEDRESGLGLGLAIVRAVAIAHGGSVSVAGEPGKGSVFELVLPA